MSETPEVAASVTPTLRDFESDVFDAVYSSLVPEYLAAGNFQSEYVPEPESFPFGTLIRMDSFPDWRRESTSNEEDLTVDTYEAKVFALSMDECKSIMNVLAERMRQMNFRRLTMRPVLNGNDVRVSQIVARFEHRINSRGQMFR